MVVSVDVLPDLFLENEYNCDPSVREAFEMVKQYAGGLLEDKINTDTDTLDHELGVAMLAGQMLPAELADAQIDFFGVGVRLKDLVMVAGALHDSGKYRADIQACLSGGVFSGETRQWVRKEHCQEGASQIRKYQNSVTGMWLSPAEQLALEVARFVSGHHHSQMPENYEDPAAVREQLSESDSMLLSERATELRLTEEQLLGVWSVAWGVTHLIKYCDVLHAVGFDQSARRAYQKGRSGLPPKKIPEEVYEIVDLECGKDSPNIGGIVIDAWEGVRKSLGLPSKKVITSKLGMLTLAS